MSGVNALITLGLGTPSDIAHLALFGLSPPVVLGVQGRAASASVPAAVVGFQFYKGADIQIDWTMVPVEDITGWTFDFTVKRRDRHSGASLVVAPTDIVSAASGTFRTVIAAAATVVLSGDYRHALWRTNPGTRDCLAQGFFSITDTVRDW